MALWNSGARINVSLQGHWGTLPSHSFCDCWRIFLWAQLWRDDVTWQSSSFEPFYVWCNPRTLPFQNGCLDVTPRPRSGRIYVQIQGRRDEYIDGWYSIPFKLIESVPEEYIFISALTCELAWYHLDLGISSLSCNCLNQASSAGESSRCVPGIGGPSFDSEASPPDKCSFLTKVQCCTAL